jgi:histidinol-phosphate aminotransferase
MNEHGRAQLHGGLRVTELRALGLDPEALLDFSASIIPEPPAPTVIAAMQEAVTHDYPDPDCLVLREELAAIHRVPLSHILAGNGASELIRLAVAAFARTHNASAALCSPTFGEFAQACAGWGIAPYPIPAEADLRWTPAAVPRCDLLYLCNPNNPTGTYLTESEVRALHATGGGLLLLDEAYVPFVEDSWSSTTLVLAGNSIVVRSLTKDHGIAGVRLGYALAAPELIERMHSVQPTWSVSSIAQAAGIAALRHRDRTLADRTAARRRALVQDLRCLGTEVIEGAANFVLVRADGATPTRIALLKRGIVVRDCTSFGMPAWIRVAVRTPAENALLVSALRAVLGGGT